MSQIRIGCQTYTWEMLGDDWKGSLQDIIMEVAAAGYAGIEISSNVLGDFMDKPLEVRAMLDANGLQLAAIAFSTPSGFTYKDAVESDLNEVKRAIAFLSHFSEPTLGLAGANSPSHERHYDKVDQACLLYNEIGKLAQAAGVSVNVHPHSHHGSLLETDQEYSYMMKRLDAIVALGPDSGHIIRGGQDLVECIQKHAKWIKHIHFKDVKNREWTPIGQGISDFRGVIQALKAADYQGWIIAEEEATWTLAGRNTVLPANEAYIKKLLEI